MTPVWGYGNVSYMSGENFPEWVDCAPVSGPTNYFLVDHRPTGLHKNSLIVPFVTGDPEWSEWLIEACGRNRETGIWPMAKIILDTIPVKTVPAIKFTHETPLTAYLRELSLAIVRGVIDPAKYAIAVNAILEGVITEKDLPPPDA